MNHLVFGLSLILSRKDSRLVIILSSLAFFLLLLIVQNGMVSLQILSFETIPLFKRLLLALSTIFNISTTFTSGSVILATLGSLLGGINLSLAYTYLRTRGELILESGLYSGIGLVFAFLGIGCAACGTAFLSIILGLFGFSTMLNILPYKGQEIGYIGIIFLCIATYSLAKKVSQYNVC